LLQQRGADKRLWPMYWSNSCCSHPRHGEDMQSATARRLTEELGINAELEFVYKFSYQANFDESGSENELCWVFLGSCDQLPQPNQTEIAAARFVRVDRLEAELESRPEDFTPWFKMEWQCLRGEHRERVENYTS
jgi:isopentenyl-diphosphate delta-isomerase